MLYKYTNVNTTNETFLSNIQPAVLDFEAVHPSAPYCYVLEFSNSNMHK